MQERCSLCKAYYAAWSSQSQPSVYFQQRRFCAANHLACPIHKPQALQELRSALSDAQRLQGLPLNIQVATLSLLDRLQSLSDEYGRHSGRSGLSFVWQDSDLVTAIKRGHWVRSGAF